MDAEVVRRWPRWVLALPLAGVVLGFGLVFVLGSSAGFPLTLLSAIAVLLLRSPRTAQTTVTASASEIRIGDETIARRDVLRADFLPRTASGPVVRLVLRGRTIDLRVADEDAGRSLLEALGFDAEHIAAHFHADSLGWSGSGAASYILSGVSISVVGVLLVKQGLVALGLPVVLVPLAIILALASSPVRIDVGADGVLLRWLGRRTFVPTARIELAEVYESELKTGVAYCVRLRIRDEDPVEVTIGMTEHAKAQAAALVERVQDSIEAHRGANVEGAALLDRGTRSIAEWISDLRAIGGGETATLRTAAISSERLWSIVHSAAARPVDRAAAAVALSATEEERVRIRMASDAVVEPKLRVALQSAAEEETAALEKALEELEV